MNTLYGFSLVPAPHMVEVKEVRVPGGYMNRWLIRAFRPVPSRKFITDRMNSRIYAHPEVIQEIKRAATRAYPQFNAGRPF